MHMKNVVEKTLTNAVSRPNLTVLAVYLLGGDKNLVDTEDVAMKCNELIPGVFVWNKYPDQINLKLIEAFLYDAKKQRCGELLSGTSRRGWRLTPKGMDWMASQGRSLLETQKTDLGSRRTKAGSIDRVRKDRERQRLTSSTAWQCWRDGKAISVRDAQAIFRIDDYATGAMLEMKVVRLRSLFEGDDELDTFVRKIGDVVLNTEK
ncbi:MAG: hypothetical protein BMS9Abin08_0473 [Gammaproteobacteria bacterium]|nr:MAG: hypothetical protein BMS9Abin08_0473 [Gammaproteobacteria bacterium]